MDKTWRGQINSRAYAPDLTEIQTFANYVDFPFSSIVTVARLYVWVDIYTGMTRDAFFGNGIPPMLFGIYGTDRDDGSMPGSFSVLDPSYPGWLVWGQIPWETTGAYNSTGDAVRFRTDPARGYFESQGQHRMKGGFGPHYPVLGFALGWQHLEAGPEDIPPGYGYQVSCRALCLHS